MEFSQVLNPSKWLLIRGNHETREVNGNVAHYGPGSFLSQVPPAYLYPKYIHIHIHIHIHTYIYIYIYIYVYIDREIEREIDR